jgi:hypothetical protein
MNATIDRESEPFQDGGKEEIEAGQSQLAERMRILLYKLALELFELVDFYDNDTFLEPLLFAYFVDPKPVVKLEQILFGYMAERLKPAEISVYTDRRGIVNLPRIGYLCTKIENEELRLLWKEGLENCVLKHGDRLVEHIYEAPIMVNGTAVEVCRYNHPLLERLFVDEAGDRVDVDIEQITRRQINNVSKAFQIIQQQIPDYYEQMVAVTKKIVIYSGARPYSFATLSAHGIVFLNSSPEDDEAFFIEDLIHQCGHLIFNALSLEPQQLLRIASNTLLKDLTGDERDTRDIYTTLHGVFTAAWMNKCMDRCCDSSLFSPRQRHELLGRFALILTRFGCDLRNLTASGIFTEKGKLLLSWFTSVYCEIVGKRYDLLASLDVSNQPYCFSYDSFQMLNPLRANTQGPSDYMRIL